MVGGYVLALAVLASCRFAPASAPDDAAGDGAAPADTPRHPGGLIAHYRMETLASGIASDATGRGHHGQCATPACPTLVPAPDGNGYHFTGLQRIDVDGGGELDDVSAFTVAGWVRFDTFAMGNYQCVFSKLWGTTDSNAWQLCARAAPSRSWFYGTRTDLVAFHSLVHETDIEVEEWMHVAITWDGSRKRLWIDGSEVANQQVAGVVSDGQRVMLGGELDYGNHANGVRGAVDDVQIYDRALTDDELERLAGDDD